ncbi:unnamed protein product [Nippostrongylus brasiliensis]|uniref:Btz domain-containing protein n=1 Tax=Nippostrongylus brasiliensis TaxID=27835 RepID=A0A0N4XJW1_NIPBR|nr:unnamed protein product [Nippostrongylus brasiliensis]
MERNDGYRDRQGRRDYNYRQRQYNKFDDDREEPVPEDPRVDRNDEDGWGDADYQAAGYHHDQHDNQHKGNRHYHRPYNRGGYRGRSRGFFNNRQVSYNRDASTVTETNTPNGVESSTTAIKTLTQIGDDEDLTRITTRSLLSPLFSS